MSNSIEEFLGNLFSPSDNVWSLHICPTGGHIGLHNISLDFEILQTGVGTLEQIMIKAKNMSEKLEENPKVYINAVSRISPLQQQLQHTGDTLFFDQMQDIVNECRKSYGENE